ncbi:MAG: hypothetical protein ACTSUB_09555 [Candidatus Thorarchaeota archaeon]
MRLARFLTIIGGVLILLSIISPIVEPSYEPVFDLRPDNFRGYMVHCNSGLDIQISSRSNVPFSVYFMTYENGLKTLEEGSVENITVIQVFSNTTSFNGHLSIPIPGWYSVLVTPSSNESITFLEVEFGKQIPNQGLVLIGSSFLFVGILWFFVRARR